MVEMNDLIKIKNLFLVSNNENRNLIDIPDLQFDNNSISIDGPTSLAEYDNFEKRFNSYGWNYIQIDGHNEKKIFKAFEFGNKINFSDVSVPYFKGAPVSVYYGSV